MDASAKVNLPSYKALPIITLYFVVEKELEDIDGVETANGFKEINVYDMVNNKPEVFARLELTNDENSRDAINNYLNDNGYVNEMFELIEL